MPIDLGGVTAATVRLALDVAQMRHQVIANNLANAKTEDFHAKRLDFERILSSELDLDTDRSERTVRAAIDRVADRMTSPTAIRDAADPEVALDQEMANLADNTIRYRALLAALGKQMSIVRTAIDGGNR
jgi:flagellar basal-body rod protein FlgB